MPAVTLTTTIARPPEEVFAYLADIANHAEFTDHFLVDWRLTREDSYGRGAGARFRVKQPLKRFSFSFVDVTLVEVQPPRPNGRLVAEGRGGRYNRTRIRNTWSLQPAPGGGTEVTFVAESEPAARVARLLEGLGIAARLTRRGHERALERLRTILEKGEDRGPRATISGGPRKPATGFRL